MKIKIVLAALALLITIGIVTLVNSEFKNAMPDTEQVLGNEVRFDEQNFNWMLTDSFTNLVTKAYGASSEITRANNIVVVQIKDANAMAADFFNGNLELLKFKINENNFEIDYDKQNNTVIGRFMTKDRLVAVPNDVLIKLIDKTIN